MIAVKEKDKLHKRKSLKRLLLNGCWLLDEFSQAKTPLLVLVTHLKLQVSIP
jgi:hypothetical protein